MLDHQFNFLKGLIALTASVMFVLVFGYILRTVSQKSLEQDMSLVALSVAREKMNQVLAKKAYYGYEAVKSESEEVVYVGRWGFLKQVDINFVDPEKLKISAVDLGLKRIIVKVSWSRAVGSEVSLYSLVSNQTPNLINGPEPIKCNYKAKVW